MMNKLFEHFIAPGAIAFIKESEKRAEAAVGPYPFESNKEKSI
jgi:hypothetical protein